MKREEGRAPPHKKETLSTGISTIPLKKNDQYKALQRRTFHSEMTVFPRIVHTILARGSHIIGFPAVAHILSTDHRYFLLDPQEVLIRLSVYRKHYYNTFIMRFLCKTRDILQTIGIVSRAISSQQAMPILGNILFHSEGKRCTLSATNLEFSIISSFEAEVENEGSLTVPAKAIQNFAQYSTDEEILFESSEEAQLKCLSKKSKTIIAGESASEYPTISPIERENVFQIDSDQFLQAIAHVTFASARTTIRPVLSGVYFKGVKDELSLVATDSYRLSEYKIPLLEKQGEIDCIVPTKVLIEVMAVLSGGRKGKEDAGDETKKEDKISSQGPVRISLSAQQIEIVAGKTTVLSRLIDGSFPDYKQILPSSSKTTIHFPLAEILTNIRRMHYFAKESNNNLTIAVSGEEVLIQTQRTQIGRDESHIPTTIIGEKNKIALSSSYLLDFLTHISGEEVHMEIVDKMHPALFRVPGLPNFLHLIMPLRMTEE